MGDGGGGVGSGGGTKDPRRHFPLPPGHSDGKEFACNAGDLGSISGQGRFPGGGNGNPLQYSCLENPMERGGAWEATVHRATQWDTTEKNQHLPEGGAQRIAAVIYRVGFKCLSALW